jgi:hypothetical protein
LIEFLQKNPLLAALTGIGAALTALNSFVGPFGFPPFWADVLVSALLAYVGIYWCLAILREMKRRAIAIGLGPKPNKKLSFITRFARVAGGSIIVPIILMIPFGWNVTPPAAHLKDTDWALCGTFVASCKGEACIELYDARNRKVTDRCYPFDDDSGYKKLSAPNWWTYKPQAVDFRCDGKLSGRGYLNAAMFSRSCDGVSKIQ